MGTADERRYDAVFLAEASFVIRGRYFIIAGDVIEGVLRNGDRILYTEPETDLAGRTILAVETGARIKGDRFVGLCIAPDTDPVVRSLQAIPLNGVKLMIVSEA